jgi:hypothetical protein
MTPRQLGHRDAAWGALRKLPDNVDMGVSGMEFYNAFDAVEAHRAKGLDPSGHPPRIPHLCTRDVSKVCNCCDSCGVACWAERFDGVTVRGLAKDLLRKVLRR